MIFDDERSLRTVNNAPNTHILKIFLYLAFNQPHDGITGYQIEKSELQYDLKLGRTVFFNALHWLKDNIVIHELKLADKSDFMLNPYIVMNNGDQNARIKEWNRRLRLENEKIRRNRELKRRRELNKLKKANQQ